MKKLYIFIILIIICGCSTVEKKEKSEKLSEISNLRLEQRVGI